MALIAAAGCASSIAGPRLSAASVPPQRIRPSWLAPAALPARAATLGGLGPATPVEIEVVLAPSHPTTLADTLSSLYDPASTSFHHWLTAGEFDREFAPASSTVDSVETWMREGGLAPAVSGFAVLAHSTASAVSSLLATPMLRYRENGQLGFSTTEAPLVPSSVAPQIVGILGLTSGPALLPQLSVDPGPHGAAARRLTPHESAPTPCATAASFAASKSAYTTDEAGASYGINALVTSGLLGTGETIALLELAAHAPSDTAAYAACYGLTSPITTVPVDGGGIPQPGDGTSEANLDIEQAETQAPGADIVAYEAPDTGVGDYEAWQKIVDDDTAQVVSTSWGLCESQSRSGMDAMSSLDPLFEQAAMQGQTIVAAAGDSGSEDCWGSEPTDTDLSVEYPASDPWVTGIGGTSLSAGAETVWNDCLNATNASCANGGGGAGGGGLSSYWTEPTWQLGADTMTSSGTACSPHCRGVPDLSVNAGASETFYDGGAWTLFIGTSIGAPMVAGMVADIVQGCVSRIGDLAPALYAGETADGYGDGLTDVTSGNNDLTRTYSGTDYTASAGWDAASGLGTPMAADLACPTVTALEPSSSPSGAEITVEGTNLLHASILFGATKAQVVSATESAAVVVVPNGSGATEVAAASPLGTGSAQASFVNGTAPVTTTTTPPAPVPQASSPAAAPTTTTTTRPPAVAPGAVRITALKPGNHVAQIRWAKPASIGTSAVTSYVVGLSNCAQWLSSRCIVRLFRTSAASRTLSFAKLHNKKRYWLWVMAVNAAGDGPASYRTTIPKAPVITTSMVKGPTTHLGR